MSETTRSSICSFLEKGYKMGWFFETQAVSYLVDLPIGMLEEDSGFLLNPIRNQLRSCFS